MALGPKTRRFLAARRNPGSSVYNFLSDMEETAAEIAKNAVEQAVAEVTADLDEKIKKAYVRAGGQLDQLAEGLVRELRRGMREKIDSLPHLKGDPGDTPKKGVDYFDGEDGVTPIAGVDFPTFDMFEQSFREYTKLYQTTLEEQGLNKKQILAEMQQLQMDQKSVTALVRAIEKLPKKARLDYYNGLKNQPSIPSGASSHHRTLHRGGGSQVFEYDLSSFCDGVTKVFTVPPNSRIVHVENTDAPMGIMRKTTDWTGTGTTTLTLTAQVAAPGSGATLSILYVA